MSVCLYYLIAIFAVVNCGPSSSKQMHPRPLIVPRWSDFCVAGNEQIRGIEDDCQQRYGITQPQTYAYPYLSRDEQNTIRCTENCIYEEFGVYPADHRLNTTVSKTVLPEYSFQCLDDCGTYTNDDHCKQSYCITQCIYGCLISDTSFFKSYCLGPNKS